MGGRRSWVAFLIVGCGAHPYPPQLDRNATAQIAAFLQVESTTPLRALPKHAGSVLQPAEEELSFERSHLSTLLEQPREEGCGRPSVLVSTDVGQDPDDHFALLLLAAMHRKGRIQLAAVVSTYAPADKRAKLAKALLVQSGLPDVPVGVGSDGGSEQHKNDKGLDMMSMSSIDEVQGNGIQLMKDTVASSGPCGVTLLCIGSMKDPNTLLQELEKKHRKSIKQVVLMGGAVKVAGMGAFSKNDAGLLQTGRALGTTFLYAKNIEELEKTARETHKLPKVPGPLADVISRMAALKWAPDNAANYLFDKGAASDLFEILQSESYSQTSFITIERSVAFAAKIGRNSYDEMSTTVIGGEILEMQGKKMLVQDRDSEDDKFLTKPATGLWALACAGIVRNRLWYCKEFLLIPPAELDDKCRCYVGEPKNSELEDKAVGFVQDGFTVVGKKVKEASFDETFPESDKRWEPLKEGGKTREMYDVWEGFFWNPTSQTLIREKDLTDADSSACVKIRVNGFQWYDPSAALAVDGQVRAEMFKERQAGQDDMYIGTDLKGVMMNTKTDGVPNVGTGDLAEAMKNLVLFALGQPQVAAAGRG